MYDARVKIEKKRLDSGAEREKMSDTSPRMITFVRRAIFCFPPSSTDPFRSMDPTLDASSESGEDGRE